jgi:organic hydroperoxide reductase OsmC/OhrA
VCIAPNFAYRDRASQGVHALGRFMKDDVMNRLEKVLYTAKAHTTGGRAGMSRSSDSRLEVGLSRLGSPGTGTNPEQLFAAGWSACLESAMEFAARKMKITLPADHAVDAEIDLGPEGGAFSLAGSPLGEPAGEWSTRRRSALSRRPTRCVPIREQRTGTSPSKRRWSEAAPMRADNDRQISVHRIRGEGP